MKAVFAADVRGDLFVTIETQIRLALTISAVVAERALLLVLGMSAGDFAGHEQGLGVHGITAARRQYKQQQPHEDQPARSSPQPEGL
jgi:hypothetical protein